jgi:hypothetical protein
MSAAPQTEAEANIQVRFSERKKEISLLQVLIGIGISLGRYGRSRS